MGLRVFRVAGVRTVGMDRDAAGPCSATNGRGQWSSLEKTRAFMPCGSPAVIWRRRNRDDSDHDMLCTWDLCLAFFLWLDGRAGHDRLLPIRPFDFRKPTGSALLMIFSLSLATIAVTAFGPLLITTIHKASALTAGYILACSSIGWTVTAVLVSGSPERLDRLMIALGMSLVVSSIAGFLYAVPNGPVWLIAVFAATEGAGFGMAWTFILRRTTALANPYELAQKSR